MSSSAAGIPLHCICCAKKPRFSDVSHLLTHVQSKGHLSQYYKLKIKAGSDPVARQTIDDFDQWYADYNVEDLMQDRMSLKDKRRVRPRAPGSSRAGSRAGSAAPRPNSRGGRPSTSGGYFDARLADRAVKRESNHTPPPFGNPQNLFAPPLPPFTNGWLQHPPIMRGQAHMQDWADHHSESSALTSLASTEPSTISPDGEGASPVVDEHAVAQNCKLKGQYSELPGMGIFDSATPDERRKRNQKKDPAVIKQLQHSSTLINDTEFVWSPEGSLRRELKITGFPEEDLELSSPLKPTPRKPTRPHTPARMTRNILAEIENVDRRPYQLHSRSVSASDQDGADDQRVEVQLGYGAGHKRKRLDVFQDEEQPRFHRSIHYGTMADPPPLNYLTAPYHPSSSAPPAFHHQGQMAMAPDGPSKAPGSAHGLFHPEKENFGPIHPPPFQPGFCSAGLPMPQYHQRQTSANLLPNPLLSPYANFFVQQSHHIESLSSPLKLSPLKLERSREDDDRTITAPNSEV